MTERLCLCGCGQPTPLAVRSNPRYGLIGGQQTYWLKGHIRRGVGGYDPAVRLRAGSSVDDGGCWLWPHSINDDGYGSIGIGGRTLKAHRVSYEAFVGPIPDGLTIDHACHDDRCSAGSQCRHRRCVNPDHLKAVPLRENTLRSHVTPAAINARKTHCIRGHEFAPTNTYVDPDGKRGCRVCRRLAEARRLAKGPRIRHRGRR